MFKADSISYEIDYKELSLGKKLGQGGFGVVYQGTYRHSDVAVKQLLEQNISKEAAAEFAAEAVVMANLRHENIVQFYGYCVSPQYCIVMEYMSQGSLFSVLHSQQPLDWPERFRIAVDIAKGIAVLHCEHILHRDIKSLNVLLNAHRKAKLTDFGLSKVKTETYSRTRGGPVGTFAWMAPELSDEEGQYSSACDIYSLGVTFWELATSKTPFSHVDGQRQMMIPMWAKQGKREPIPQACPKPLADLIQACWATDPSVRPSAEDIVVRLKTVTGELMTKTLDSENASASSDMSSPKQSSESSKSTSGPSPAASGPVYQMNSAATSSGSLRSAKLFDSVDPEAVLKKLKAFFISGDYEGEETEDLELYNQILEPREASLVYSKKKQTHTLCVKDAPLEVQAAIKEISGMIASLKASSASALQPSQPLPKSPSSQSASSGSLPSSSPPEKSNVSILTPPKKIEIAPVMPKVTPQELNGFLFLRSVAEGEQGKAEAMLKQTPALILVSGDVIDLSKRTFRNITALQYAVWALDWHMWTMLLRYVPKEHAREQLQQANLGSWVNEHGATVNWQNLIDAQKKYIDNVYAKWNGEQCRKHWIQQVGGAQLLLPAHVINEYCHPARSFYPCPDFRKPELNDVWRIRKINHGEWFTARYNDGGLGSSFGVGRGAGRSALGHGGSGKRDSWVWTLGRAQEVERSCTVDHAAVITLFTTRQKQRDDLLIDLSRAHVPMRAAMS